MSRTYMVRQQSELAAFALVVLLIGMVFTVNLFLNFGADKEYVAEIKEIATTLRKYFPEGEPLYTKAEETAANAYQVKKKLKELYSSNVEILVNLIKGNISIPVSHLILGMLAKYILVLGFIKGFTLKVFKIAVFIPLVLGGLALFGKKLVFLQDVYNEIFARFYDPFGDKDIRTVLKVLRANPVPASIVHHLSEKGGLLEHSINVAIKASDKAAKEGIDPKDAYLAGLLHDVGKLKVYVYDAPKKTYRSVGIDLDLMNRIVMNEIKERFGIRIPSDERVWEIVKQADREATAEELKKYKIDIQTVVEQALRELNINGIEGRKYDGWVREDLPFVVVLAHAINRKVTILLKEKDKGLPIPEDPDHRGVHVIAYSNPYKELIFTEYEGKKADELGLFDARIGNEVFKAVYLFKKSHIPEELLVRWGNNPYMIEILERSTEKYI